MNDILRELKIDMDNLCSFMPQDKVGDFTRQTPKGKPLSLSFFHSFFLSSFSPFTLYLFYNYVGVLHKTLQCIAYTAENNTITTLAHEQDLLAYIESDKNQHKNDVEAKEKAIAALTNSVKKPLVSLHCFKKFATFSFSFCLYLSFLFFQRLFCEL